MTDFPASGITEGTIEAVFFKRFLDFFLFSQVLVLCRPHRLTQKSLVMPSVASSLKIVKNNDIVWQWRIWAIGHCCLKAQVVLEGLKGEDCP